MCQALTSTAFSSAESFYSLKIRHTVERPWRRGSFGIISLASRPQRMSPNLSDQPRLRLTFPADRKRQTSSRILRSTVRCYLKHWNWSMNENLWFEISRLRLAVKAVGSGVLKAIQIYSWAAPPPPPYWFTSDGLETSIIFITSLMSYEANY